MTNSRFRIALLIGTRPEAIKMMPLWREIQRSSKLESWVIFAGQHQELATEVLEMFGCQPDVSLNVMQRDQRLTDLVQALLPSLVTALDSERLDGLLVQGDTCSAMIGALLGFLLGIPVGHVEAGLRTYDMNNPFPEEFNRRAIGLSARWHFAPTRRAQENLLRERNQGKILVVGNTGLDAARIALDEYACSSEETLGKISAQIPQQTRYAVVTAHRRESFGVGIRSICSALRRIAEKFPEIQLIFPVHPNPNVSVPVGKEFRAIPNVHLTGPLRYDELISLMRGAFAVLTDSGGMQEEAAYLHVPLIVMRDRTERQEAIDAGCAVLAGTSVDGIFQAFDEIAGDDAVRGKMRSSRNPFGDGYASKRIAAFLEEDLDRS